MQGVPQLRERISEKVQELYGAKYDPASEITVTSGATEALFAAITAVVHEGDEVVILEPAYDSYVPVISLCGATPVYVQLEFPSYRIAWDQVRTAISEKTRAIYQKKREKFLDALKGSRFKALPCKGTYFQMLDYSEITDESDLEFAGRLTTDVGVAAIPPSVFYHGRDDYKVLRFCFAKKEETLARAAKRLCRI